MEEREGCYSFISFRTPLETYLMSLFKMNKWNGMYHKTNNTKFFWIQGFASLGRTSGGTSHSVRQWPSASILVISVRVHTTASSDVKSQVNTYHQAINVLTAGAPAFLMDYAWEEPTTRAQCELVGASDCKCSRNQRLHVPSFARKSSRW
jgi:hypothetical protein